MGGFISAPSLPAPPPPPVLPPDPEIEARKERLEDIARRRRGRTGMIATSSRGLLALSNNQGRRKSLLGE